MKSTFGDKLFYAFNYAVLTLIGLSCCSRCCTSSPCR